MLNKKAKSLSKRVRCNFGVQFNMACIHRLSAGFDRKEVKIIT